MSEQISSDDLRAAAPLPWDEAKLLARFWAGQGTLFEWVWPPEWEIDQRWSPEIIRARFAYILLMDFAESLFPHLPKSSSDWMDLIEQQIHRMSEWTTTPSPYTDWPATLSEFGRYPSELYIERRPRTTFDTPHTRLLKWFCQTVARANEMVARTLGHRPLDTMDGRWLYWALEVPEVVAASDSAELDDFDVRACLDAGGTFALLAARGNQLAALWRGNAIEQLIALAPILPKLGSQIFELGVLGTAAMSLRTMRPAASWQTRTPLGAVEAGRPCLVAEAESDSMEFYYQTVPRSYVSPESPYRKLSARLGGGILRPDIWILASTDVEQMEIVIECKYSLDTKYIASGIPQILAYWLEYPAVSPVRRLHVVVCPEGTVTRPSTWNEAMVVCTPSQLAALVASVADRSVDDLIEDWS